jgi:hypothetical protein
VLAVLFSQLLQFFAHKIYYLIKMKGSLPQIEEQDISHYASQFETDVGKGSEMAVIHRDSVGRDDKSSGSKLGINNKYGRSWQYGHKNVSDHLVPKNEWAPEQRFETEKMRQFKHKKANERSIFNNSVNLS